MNELQRRLLTAYVDGELDPGEAAEVERQLAADSEARAYVERARRLDRAVRKSLDPALTLPVPERLLATVRGGGRATGGRWMRVAAAVAVLSVATLTGYYAANQRAEERIAELETLNREMTQVAAGALNRALEYQRSGEAVTAAIERAGWRITVTPLRTYRTAAGVFCREFRQETDTPEGREVTVGLSCREAKEQWTLRRTTNGGNRQNQF